MLPSLPHTALYAAFDRVPSSKGAAVHIRHMAETLFSSCGDGLLYVLGGDDLPTYQREGSWEAVRYPGTEPHLLDRASGFSAHLARLLDPLAPQLHLAHFRDPWSGIPLLRAGRRYRTVYEVNGLPSIELPQRYPRIASRTVDKLRALERHCLAEASHLIVPAHTLRTRLVALGAPAHRISVIPNGADLLACSPPRPAGAPTRYLLYFGALQPWQGVEDLLRAFALLADLEALHLVVCSSTGERSSRALRRLALKLGLADRTVWHHQLSQEELVPWLAHATLSIAPLIACDRNLDQGCCPLKILESMGAGVPVIASDLPAVRELIEDGGDGRLVKPGRPTELARAIRVALEYPENLRAMAERARAKVAASYTWGHSRTRLEALYHALFSA